MTRKLSAISNYTSHLFTIVRKKQRTEHIIIYILLISALIPRVVFLDAIPRGLNGDEAWTAIDALRILHEGWIGAYLPSALGQPVGPLYITAVIFQLFGNSIYWLRFSMALFGILTIPLLYMLLRQSFSRWASVLTTVSFSCSLYHLHYSRIAFMLIAAPVFQIAAYIFLFSWRSHNSRRDLVLCALFTGLGVYTYNTFPLFPLTIGAFLLYRLMREAFSRKAIVDLIVFSITVLFVASPLFTIIIFQPEYYFQHHGLVSELNLLPDHLSLSEKIHTINSQGLSDLYVFFSGHYFDYTDGFGKFPPFATSTLIFAALGVITTIRKPTEKNVFFLFSLMLFLIPLFLTVNYGLYRREILAIVPLFYLAGLGLTTLFRRMERLRQVAILLIAALILTESYISLHTYFDKFKLSAFTKYAFNYDLTLTSHALSPLTRPETHILFFADRWSCQYETSRYLFNTKNCENRSREFGMYSTNTLYPSDTTFVLLGRYLPLIDELRLQYPNGTIHEITDPDTNIIVGIIYEL